MASSRILGFPLTTVVWTGRQDGNRRRHCTQVRAHSYGDREGRSRRHIVDAGLRLLKERMEEIRVKDHLERCLYREVADDDRRRGWNYYYIPAGDSCKRKLPEESMAFFHELSEIVTVVAATFGCTILSSTLFIFLVSVFVHLNQ